MHKVHFKYRDGPAKTAEFNYKRLALEFLAHKKAAGYDAYLERDGEDADEKGVAGLSAPYLSDYEW